MQKDFIFFILSTVLLIKQSLCKTESISMWSEKSFRDAVIAKFTPLTEEPIKLGKQLLEDIYADKSNNSKVSTALAEIMRDFEMDDVNNPVEKIGAFLDYNFLFDVLSDPNSYDNNDETRDVKLAMKEAIEKKYDIRDVANKFQQKFDEFLEWLTWEYEGKGDEVMQRRSKSFIELCLQFREGPNSYRKGVLRSLILSRLGYY